MDRMLKSIAKKIHENPAMYSYLEREYWSRATRKSTLRTIAGELEREGIVARVTPARVKKQYYKLRAHYRRVQKKDNLNPALLIQMLNDYESDVPQHMGFLKCYIHYKDSMLNH